MVVWMWQVFAFFSSDFSVILAVSPLVLSPIFRPRNLISRLPLFLFSSFTPCPPAPPFLFPSTTLFPRIPYLQHVHHSRVPGSANSTSSPLPPAPAAAPAPYPEPSAHSWVTSAGDGGRLSSDEGDAETPEEAERPVFYCSDHHPQPLGVNTATVNAA